MTRLLLVVFVGLLAGCAAFFAPAPDNRPFGAYRCGEVRGAIVYTQIENETRGGVPPLSRFNCPNLRAVEADMRFMSGLLASTYQGVAITWVDDWIPCGAEMARSCSGSDWVLVFGKPGWREALRKELVFVHLQQHRVDGAYLPADLWQQVARGPDAPRHWWSVWR